MVRESLMPSEEGEEPLLVEANEIPGKIALETFTYSILNSRCCWNNWLIQFVVIYCHSPGLIYFYPSHRGK